MMFWEWFDFLYETVIFLCVAYFSVMTAFMPRPKYIHDKEQNDESN
jgi:hypothetical protein